VLGITFALRDWRKQRKTSAAMGGNPAERFATVSGGLNA